MWRSTYQWKWHEKNYPSRIFSLTNCPASHYSTIKHEFSYYAKCLPVRAFTIRGPLWSSSIFTSYQPKKENSESYIHQTLLGPLPKPLCCGDFFKGWHQWQPTVINTYLLEVTNGRHNTKIYKNPRLKLQKPTRSTFVLVH